MIATAQTALTGSSRQVGLLRMRDVVARYNVSETTIRRATEDGSLSCLTLPSGHRRFNEADVLKWLGLNQADAERKLQGDTIPVYLYARTSSHGQARGFDTAKGDSRNGEASDLQRQVARLKAYAKEHYGTEGMLLADIGSGVNMQRPNFLKLISALIRGELRGGVVIVSYWDRLARIAIQLIEHIIKECGAKLVLVEDASEEKDPQAEMLELITVFMTHTCNRINGMRAKKTLTVNLDERALRDAYLLYKAVHSFREIQRMFKAEGRKDAKGNFYKRGVIANRVRDNWAMLERLYKTETRNSFEDFCQRFVKKTSERVLLSRGKLKAAYVAYCTKNNLHPVPNQAMSAHALKMQWPRKINPNRQVTYVGLALNVKGA